MGVAGGSPIRHAEQDRRKGPPPDELCTPGYTARILSLPPMDLAGLKPGDLDRYVDGPMGRMSVNALFLAAVIANANMHCGESATVKGLQGLKGYPF